MKNGRPIKDVFRMPYKGYAGFWGWNAICLRIMVGYIARGIGTRLKDRRKNGISKNSLLYTKDIHAG